MRVDEVDRRRDARDLERRAAPDQSVRGALPVRRTDPGRSTGHHRLADQGDCDMSRLAFPFGPAASGRSAAVVYGSDAHVRQMLELLIFTMAGERVMRPDLGSPV